MRRRKSLLNSKSRSLGILVVVSSILIFTHCPLTESLVIYTATVTITPMHEYSGVATVRVTGSSPNGMDTDQFGYFGAVFWNPTSDSNEITQVEFSSPDANTANLNDNNI